MQFCWRAAILCLVSILSSGFALSYSGVLKGSAKLAAPSFSDQGYECSTGSGAPTEFVSFSFDVSTAPTAFFIRAMLDSTINGRSTVRVSSSAPAESDICAGVLRGAVSSELAPNVQFVHWSPVNGTYFITLHLITALADQDNGLFAISVDEAYAAADTAKLLTMWYPPIVSSGICQQGEISPYAYAKWAAEESGWHDANVVLENPNDDGMESTLSIWACATATDLPGNGFNASETFETCSANNSNSCVNVGIRQSSLGFPNQNMHVTYGASAIVPRFWANPGTTYYFMFGADSGSTANSTGYVALIVEKSRFEVLQTQVPFTSPDPFAANCTSNIENQANAFFYFVKDEHDAVVIVDTGATEFDTIGSFYLGNNSARHTCPDSWYTTKDLDQAPVGIVISEDYQAASVIISPYSGAGGEGWLVQLWALSGPAIPPLTPTQPPTTAPSGSPTPGTTPGVAPAIPIASPTRSPSGAPSLIAGLGAVLGCMLVLIV